MPFSKIKEAVLGKQYALNVVFIPPKRMQELNRRYRKKDSATDVLAFPLSKKEGELYLCMQMVRKKAPEFGMNARDYLGYLFIHGLVHLKGHDHGSAMEKLEEKFCKLLRIERPEQEHA